ncbi:transcriptional regulator MarR [Fictibacillus macauensis ZFHKF-1]|uniref:Transcriptional regulator MarR n=1 Tax=Fictibacillus macauensis ZFHKF-1 TaxID=1196324 RepID=I8UB96_9BACL|nr:MarR family transcriptional regulator [Fictibacillus macauensis]EIT84215.1 transcriptional regulator MarR [Fictibacillus macauensis ZFHKF-1]
MKNSKHHLLKESFDVLNRMNVLLVKEFEDLLDHQLTVKQTLLLQYIEQAGSLTVNQLAERMQSSPSAVSQLVSKLEQLHFVKRETNENNRREVHVSLGTKGVELYETYAALDAKLIDQYFSQLEEQDVQDFHRIVHKLQTFIEQGANEKFHAE